MIRHRAQLEALEGLQLKGQVLLRLLLVRLSQQRRRRQARVDGLLLSLDSLHGLDGDAEDLRHVDGVSRDVVHFSEIGRGAESVLIQSPSNCYYDCDDVVVVTFNDLLPAPDKTQP